MKAWITTYALSTGIKEVDGEISEQFGSMLRYGSYLSSAALGDGQNWHRTKEGAVSRAEEMRIAKIGSLERQLEDMRHLRFAVEDIETTKEPA